jgi:hypothetical protein
MSFYYFAIPDSLKPIRIENLPVAAEEVPALCAMPNPFNPTVTLAVSLKGRGAGPARILILDAAGRKVFERSLSESALEHGPLTLIWNSEDRAGRRAASGVYFAQVSRKGFSQEKRITLLK